MESTRTILYYSNTVVIYTHKKELYRICGEINEQELNNIVCHGSTNSVFLGIYDKLLKTTEKIMICNAQPFTYSGKLLIESPQNSNCLYFYSTTNSDVLRYDLKSGAYVIVRSLRGNYITFAADALSIATEPVIDATFFAKTDNKIKDNNVVMKDDIIASSKITTKEHRGRHFSCPPELMVPRRHTLEQAQQHAINAHNFYANMVAKTTNHYPISRIIAIENEHHAILFLDGFIEYCSKDAINEQYLKLFIDYLIAREADRAAKFDESHKEKFNKFIALITLKYSNRSRVGLLDIIFNLDIFGI